MEWFREIWEWLVQFWQNLTWSRIIVGALFSLLTVVVSYGIIVFGMVKIPADYFSPKYIKPNESDRHFSIRWTTLIVKNLIGFLLIIAGIIMIFTPGPGVPTILLGLVMMDIPGKRPLEARLIQRPMVLSAVNDLRARYNKPPLIMD